LCWLVLFHILFFYSLYTKPFQLATSELLSTFFPSWIKLGRGGRDTYWLVPNAHPVLATYYPIHRITAFIGARLNLDMAFVLLVYTLLLHTLFASIGWYLAFRTLFDPLVAVFGAITASYMAYSLKQQPCAVYTMAWLPFLLLGIQIHSILLAGISFGMILLAGYYPIGIYSTLLAVCASVWRDTPLLWIPIGFAIGLVQLVPFLRYLPKTIRKVKSTSVKPGPWETNFYMGIIPIISLIINPQWRYLWILAPIVLSIVLKSFLPRIHYRAWIISSYLVVWMSLSRLTHGLIIPVLILQSLDLWLHNRSLLPTRPYCELYQRPLLVFKSRLVKYLELHLGTDRVSGLPFPLFTGLINNFNTLGYCGGMQLKLMAKWRGDTDPNGAGNHDYFRGKEDGAQLVTSRVKFAYTRSGINWESTPIPHLYKNPNYGN